MFPRIAKMQSTGDSHGAGRILTASIRVHLMLFGAMALIRGLRVFSDFELEFRMGLANKKLASQIETIAIMTDERHVHISSTTIREIAELGGDVSSMVPQFVKEALTKRFAELHKSNNSPGYMTSIRD